MPPYKLKLKMEATYFIEKFEYEGNDSSFT